MERRGWLHVYFALCPPSDFLNLFSSLSRLFCFFLPVSFCLLRSSASCDLLPLVCFLLLPCSSSCLLLPLALFFLLPSSSSCLSSPCLLLPLVLLFLLPVSFSACCLLLQVHKFKEYTQRDRKDAMTIDAQMKRLLRLQGELFLTRQ